ncbi:MAG: AbrB/MazE/SpoVT family DNA-binding domain-containing protein [Candidatus Odinarchaeota archaeon]
MINLKMLDERVSTVGVRNQVTLPKVIRKKAKIREKAVACIQARDKDGSLAITLNPPEQGVYNRIKISGKGQLVIPKNLRESKGIKEGVNLVFSINGDGEITMKKLAERRGTKSSSKRWDFLISTVGILYTPELDKLTVEGNSLSLRLKKEPGNATLMELVTDLENRIGTRLLIEKDRNKINLRPLLA